MKHKSSETQECEYTNNNALGIWSTRKMKHKECETQEWLNTKPNNNIKKSGANL